MPYIGNITQDFNVSNAMLDTDSVTSIKIVDGTIEGADIAANLDLSDTQKIRLGAGNDLQIYHDGSHSRIDETGTGNLMIQSNNAVFIKKGTSEDIARFNVDGAVELLYDNSKKFETVSGGAKITGTATATVSLIVGSGNDLQFTRSGGNTEIQNYNGTLLFGNASSNSNNVFIRGRADENSIICIPDGAVELYYDNTKRLETDASGVKLSNGRFYSAGTFAFIESSDTSTTTLTLKKSASGADSIDYLQCRDSSNNIKLVISGSGDIDIQDNAKLKLGDSDDLQIFHNGTHSFMENSTGILAIRSDSFQITDKSNNHAMITATADGAVELYHDNSRKLRTKTAGVEIEGELGMADNYKIKLGTGEDLQIFHDGNFSRIKDTGTGDLVLHSNTISFVNAADSETIAQFKQDGSVDLYYDHSKKFETTSYGASLTGTLCASGNIKTCTDTGIIAAGASDDLQISHDGSNSLIADVGTGALVLKSNQIDFIDSTSTEFLARFFQNSAVEFYFDSSKKFETTSDGATFSGSVLFPDNQRIKVGGDASNPDLQIYHDGSNTRIIEGGTGHLYVDTSSFIIRGASTPSETLAKFVEDGGVELYHNNVKRITTRSGGGAQDGAVIYGNSSNVAINLFTDTSERGTVYANSSNQVGFLDSGGDWAIKHTNDSQTEFYVQTNRKAAIDADGLKFNNDTAAANALDDYEEGTFTPSFGFSNDNFNGTYSAQGGAYTKIGNIVNVRFQISASKGTGTGGTATLYNLPFNAVNVDNYRASGVMGYYEGFTSDKPILILVEGNDNKFPFRHSGDTNATAIGAANMSSTFRFYISITYQTA